MQKYVCILTLALFFGLCLHSCLAETAGDEWRPSLKELLRLSQVRKHRLHQGH